MNLDLFLLELFFLWIIAFDFNGLGINDFLSYIMGFLVNSGFPGSIIQSINPLQVLVRVAGRSR